MKQEKFILFGNGSHYSIAVLNNLLERGIVPVAVVVPEYPPATISKPAVLKVDAELVANQFIEMVDHLSIPVIYAPRKLKSSLAEKLAPFEADYLLVACWPYLLPPETVGVAAKAALNLHPSLLPEYRGASPVFEQLNSKETRLGVTLHLLSQEYDCGEIVAQAGFRLESGSTSCEQIEVQAALVGTGLLADLMQSA
ncbi:MAG: formyltransferase family protein [Gammaproteobacteria bacterium]